MSENGGMDVDEKRQRETIVLENMPSAYYRPFLSQFIYLKIPYGFLVAHKYPKAAILAHLNAYPSEKRKSIHVDTLPLLTGYQKAGKKPAFKAGVE